ncbi:hypothetical protein ACFWIE_19665, partial [Kitasatospora griseola]
SGVTKSALTVTAGLGLTLTGTGPHPSLLGPAAVCLLASLALALPLVPGGVRAGAPRRAAAVGGGGFGRVCAAR